MELGGWLQVIGPQPGNLVLGYLPSDSGCMADVICGLLSPVGPLLSLGHLLSPPLTLLALESVSHFCATVTSWPGANSVLSHVSGPWEGPGETEMWLWG